MQSRIGAKEGGRVGETGIDIYTTVYKTDTNKNLRYSTGNFGALWWPKWEENPRKRGDRCICIWLILCCTVETNTMLWSNYSQYKNQTKKNFSHMTWAPLIAWSHWFLPYPQHLALSTLARLTPGLLWNHHTGWYLCPKHSLPRCNGWLPVFFKYAQIQLLGNNSQCHLCNTPFMSPKNSWPFFHSSAFSLFHSTLLLHSAITYSLCSSPPSLSLPPLQCKFSLRQKTLFCSLTHPSLRCTILSEWNYQYVNSSWRSHSHWREIIEWNGLRA